MDNRIPGLRPRSRDLIHALKTRFEYQWIAADNYEMWELRFLFQLIELGSNRFKINISMVANRNGSAQDLQHVAYLELNYNNEKSTLCWSDGVNSTLERALQAFQTLYPLEELIMEIRRVLAPLPIEVMMPGIDVQKLKVISS
ncbi:MAG: hypothetical protein V7739_06135 [Motiliproteus sp.]